MELLGDRRPKVDFYTETKCLYPEVNRARIRREPTGATKPIMLYAARFLTTLGMQIDQSVSRWSAR